MINMQFTHVSEKIMKNSLNLLIALQMMFLSEKTEQVTQELKNIQLMDGPNFKIIKRMDGTMYSK